MHAPYSLADTWLLNQRVDRKLLDALSEKQLALAANPRARSIADQFAHLHNVRVMWLENCAPAAAAGLRKIPKGEASKALLLAALEQSAQAMAAAIAAFEADGRPRLSRRGPVAFLGYALAHEGHHRGQIVLHLKLAGMPVARELAFGIWEWEKI